MVFNISEMGNNASLPKGRRKSLRSFVRRSNKSNLSHTFTVPEVVPEQMEFLNVNTATEEELMTLPGIDRATARNIVEHRKAIGRFRKVEDVALVRGIGARKLELLRPEISVSLRRTQSCASSRAPSYDSLKSSDSKTTNRSCRLINLNKASIFELQSVPGITQEIAAGIVTLRNKKGHFKKIDELLKVKHLSRMRLDNITRYLTVEDDDDNISEFSDPRPTILTNGYTRVPYTNGRILHRPSFRSQVPNGLAPSSVLDIFELLSTYSPRPIINELFKYARNGDPAARMCSWNLHEFTQEKAANLGVKEVICRTILENGISLLAVQDIRDVMGLKTICEELNHPTLRRVEEWKENSRSWNFCMLDVHDTHLGFIYDSEGPVRVEVVSLMESPEDTRKDCEALIAHFLIGDLNLQVVNMTLKDEANVKFLHEKVIDLVSEEELVVLCIDFSNCRQVDDASLTLGNLNPVFSSGTNTHFPVIVNGDHSSHISNILTNAQLNRHLTGYKNIVGRGLTHLAIPNGWSWGGPVSPNCPIWVELYLNTKLDKSAL